MSLDDIAATGPKAIRPALWVIAFMLCVGTLSILGVTAIESKAQVAAAAAVAPMADRVSKLENEQAAILQGVGVKLDTISQQLTQTRTDVAVLGQRVEDLKRK